MRYLRQSWSRSKLYRVALVATSVYALLRMTIHLLYVVALASPELLPEWADAEGPMIPVDLQLYVDAANRFWLQQDLYPVWDRIEIYQYSPACALLFTPFTWLSPMALVISQTLVHVVAYALLYAWWGRIFQQLGLGRAREMMVWTLPVWLIFSAFWSDLGYLNIYIVVALLTTLFIDAVLNERLGWSLLWLSIILQTKPHWAFAAVVPLLLGRCRFFLKLVGLAVVIYVAVAGATMLAVGPSYGWQQYVGYVQLLANMRQYFPWRGPDAPFLGYNHSITQIVVYLLGATPATLNLTTIVKGLLLVPLAAVSLRCLSRPAHRIGRDVPRLALDLVFALYLGAFVWLDMVWELSLGVAVFTYLLATLDRPRSRTWIWAVFLPYALVDLWQTLSFVIFGMGVVLPGMYILTDPTIYFPLTMVVILVFYGLLVRRLWGNSDKWLMFQSDMSEEACQSRFTGLDGKRIRKNAQCDRP
jgi:hypothetical protein